MTTDTICIIFRSHHCVWQLYKRAWHCLHVNCENWWREMALVAIIAAAWEPTTSHTQTALAKCLHIHKSAQVYSPWWRWPSLLRGSALRVHYSKLHCSVSRHHSRLPLRMVTRSTVSSTGSPPSSCSTRPGTRNTLRVRIGKIEVEIQA